MSANAKQESAELIQAKSRILELERKCSALEFQLRQALLALDSQGHAEQSIIDITAMKLTRKEFMIMEALRCGEFVSRDSVLQRVWGNADRFNSRSLDVFMTKLRRILLPMGYSIETYHGQGFKLVKK